MSKNTDNNTTERIAVEHSENEVPPSPYRFLSLAKGLYGTFDPDHCEFCGQFIEEPTQNCPALDEGRCRP